MKIKAVIFDMDGTMIDTGNLWIESAHEVNKLHGFNKPLDEIKSYIGSGKKDEYCSLIKTVFNKNIENNRLKTKEGLLPLLEYLKQKNIKTAVATSSSLEKVQKRFKSAGIDISIFDKIITGDMVEKNKPDPEIYITACKQLGVSSCNAVVLEDSDIGIKSATDAKIKAILIPDVVKPSSETIQLSYKIFPTLNMVKEFIDQNIETNCRCN